MKKLTLYLMTFMSLFSSCYKPVDEDSDSLSASAETTTASSETCQLSVRIISSDDDDADVLSPIHLFAFDASGRVAAQSIMADASQPEQMTLTRGQYHLTAICGADELQLSRVAAASDTILIAGTSSTEPLLMGMADVTLASTQATASLCLARQTAEVTLLPIALSTTDASANVTLSALYTTIDMNGGMQAPKPVTLPCYAENATYHLLPSFGTSLVVSLEVTADGDAPQTYGYVLQEQLRAGGRYEIAPSDQAEISFDGEEPSDTDDNDSPTLDHWPDTPCLWKNHVVVQVTAGDDSSSADLLLLSANEWDGIHSAYYEADSTEAKTIAASYLEGEMDDWHIPTKEEATALRNLFAPDSAAVLNALLSDAGYVTISLKKKSDNVRYLCNDAQHTFTFASPTASLTKAGAKATYYLRLVKVVTVKLKEE
ncbi:MAG: FimB/Mfa2 family fimbrial subunit [Bacteroidales bacterium]|nr:FimB/Mfa2 family fimbrial subunit [Bacteroidales bacterium]